MKKQVALVVCSIILFGGILNVAQAGDEDNPEISDRLNDVVYLGGLYENHLLSLFFNHIDIDSAWFFEDETNPDMLYISIKLSNYYSSRMRVWYGVFWENEKEENWAAVLIINKGEIEHAGVQLMNSGFIEVENFFSIDEANSIVTFSIPKESIGDITSGDTICYPYATAAIQFPSDRLNELFQHLPLAIDITYEGLEYIVQY
jgi:hypothetical protein